MTAVLIAVVLYHGLGVFWPAAVAEAEMADGSRVLGEIVARDVNPDNQVRTIQFKTGNRDLDPKREDFHWIEEGAVREIRYPADVFVLERMEDGDFYGYLSRMETPGLDVPGGADLVAGFQAAVNAARKDRAVKIQPIEDELASVSSRLQAIHNALRHVQYRKERVAPEEDPSGGSAALLDARLRELQAEEDQVKRRSVSCICNSVGPSRSFMTIGGVACPRNDQAISRS